MKLSTLAATLGLSAAASASKSINYTTVQGYFIQDDASTDPSSFDYVRLYRFFSLTKPIINPIIYNENNN